MPEIVVTVIDTLTRIEVDINESDVPFNQIGTFIINDPEPLRGINIGTVRASDGGHLLDTVLSQRERKKERGREFCGQIVDDNVAIDVEERR